MNIIDLAALFSTFLLVMPAELPDKTFVATLVLASRYSRTPVWIGVTAAFAVQCAIAVLAGELLSLLPPRVVSAAAATLFAVGAVVMLRGALVSRADAEREAAELEQEEQQAIARVSGQDADSTSPVGDASAAGPSALRIAGLSFTVLFVAEWGDLSQFLTAAQAARTGEPVSVFIGALLALALVAGLAVVAGGWLRERVPLHRVRFVSAGVLTVLALLAATEAIRG
jgi:putative Ca2+/H+ antiporter (TMEM165/GDT1 family)